MLRKEQAYKTSCGSSLASIVHLRIWKIFSTSQSCGHSVVLVLPCEKNTCGGERNIKVLDSVQKETHNNARNQVCKDEVVVRRFGPTTPEETATRSVDPQTCAVLLHLAPLGQSYNAIWEKHKGRKHNLHMNKRKDAGEKHTWDESKNGMRQKNVDD